VSLKDLGATFQLGHSYGSSCAIPSTTTPLTVFDVTGIHTINVTYCECDPNGPGIPLRVQLLRARWFPATWRRPSTAFTFRLLNFLHKLQSKCKINLYDFHATMVSVSDNAGLGKPPVCTLPPIICICTRDLQRLQNKYNELSLAFRIYVYLRQIRRGGGVHIAEGLSALPEGGLAVECPACPHPGRNIVLQKGGLITRPL